MPLNSFTALYLALSYWCGGSKIFFSVSSALTPMEKRKNKNAPQFLLQEPRMKTNLHFVLSNFKFSTGLHSCTQKREQQPREVCVHVGLFLCLLFECHTPCCKMFRLSDVKKQMQINLSTEDL